jgi:hypothetical protein
MLHSLFFFLHTQEKNEFLMIVTYDKERREKTARRGTKSNTRQKERERELKRIKHMHGRHNKARQELMEHTRSD